jgi:hypothetical protein
MTTILEHVSILGNLGGRRRYRRPMDEARTLGGVGTKVVFEDDRVRVWVLKLAPGERSATHRHEVDHLLIQIGGDRIAVEPEPDTAGPYRDAFEGAVVPGMVTFVPKGGIETAVNSGDQQYYEVIVELKQ